MGDAIALDLDGTILDCRPRQVAVLQHVLARLRVPSFDESTFWQLKRDGSTTVAALAMLGISQVVARHVTAAWITEIERPHWLEKDTLLAGASDALDELARAGYDLHLISARINPTGARQTLERLNIASFFSGVRIVEPGEAASGQKTSTLREIPNNVAMFGDTEVDWAAARDAGICFFALTCGQRSPTYFKRHGLLNTYRDLRTAARDFVRHGAASRATQQAVEDVSDVGSIA